LVTEFAWDGNRLTACQQKTEAGNLSAKVQEYLLKAEQCETLAQRGTDANVKTALLEAARRWRRRAELLERQTAAMQPDLPPA
jgi:hypothetical protein